MGTAHRPHLQTHRDITSDNKKPRRAVGYVRVSTDMQATDGLSLDTQTAAIEHYCSAQGLSLVRICKDVISGAKADRPGLQEALETLHRGADVLVVLKFDRLSRSIKHFCELYEQHFRSGEKELVAIRESIRLDSSLGRALVSILLVFAQMEREAIAERTREAVFHIRQRGYHHGKAPYGYKTAPAPDDPRFRVLVEDPAEQTVMMRIRAWVAQDLGMPEIAARLNQEGVKPPCSDQWRSSFLYLLAERHGWHTPRAHNQRWHTDDELKARIVELRGHGHTLRQIASILNEQKWVPLKGRRFTDASVGKLLRGCDETKHQGPKRYLESLLAKMEREHMRTQPGEPFKRPSFPRLATLLTEAGYRTPKGYERWWPAQVQQLLEGRFEQYYSSNSPSSLDNPVN
ncbi:MAG: recombinase family protein [Polyangia bacterium]